MTTSMTIEERLIIASLGDAWNQFLTLPPGHRDDLHDFRKAIHDAQRVIMSRPAYRDLQGREGNAP